MKRMRFGSQKTGKTEARILSLDCKLLFASAIQVRWLLFSSRKLKDIYSLGCNPILTTLFGTQIVAALVIRSSFRLTPVENYFLSELFAPFSFEACLILDQCFVKNTVLRPAIYITIT